MISSFARHFDRRTMGPSSDILRKRKPLQDIFNIQTDNYLECFVKYKGLLKYPVRFISSPDILLNFLLPDILSGENLPFRRTFEIFARHVRRDWRILRTLQKGWVD